MSIMGTPAYNEFKPGNQLWKLRPYNPGPPRKVENGQALYELLVEYFEWCEANPILENVVGWFKGEATDHTVEKMRAMSIKGFFAHSGLDRQLWYEWKESREDLRPVIEWADQIMWEQKFSGAAAGIFVPGIVAKDLGLADVVDHRSGDGSMSPKPNVIKFLAPEFNSPAIHEAILEEQEQEGGAAPADE
jgi:hypothetical protein